MRSFTAFLVGAIAGACCVLAVQRIQEEIENGEPDHLADRMNSRLQELEERLSSDEATA